MNRRQRRAARTQWAAGIAAVHAEAGGTLECTVIRSIDAPALLAAAASGDPEAVKFADAVEGFLTDLRARGTGADSGLCGCCDRKLIEVHFSVVIAAPFVDEPKMAIALGICTACARDVPGIKAKAAEILGRVFPNGRMVDVQHHRAGRA